MERMMITESVRNLLLDSDFLESVFGSPVEEPDAYSGRPASSRKFEKMYIPAEIEQAKYVLLHLDEISGLLSETDIEELKNRIKYHLNP
ncbi:hypothetical protein RJT11_15585 [Segatella copri]|uniref:hypothetical protein n=1 Tax=Segatella copri TaxID=165179 RepID=UPI00294AE2CC|nr:hypothetical protein [Segatella copri]WOG03604.1 hypothetical protein RJT11_15585 [Segatella copri]